MPVYRGNFIRLTHIIALRDGKIPFAVLKAGPQSQMVLPILAHETTGFMLSMQKPVSKHGIMKLMAGWIHLRQLQEESYLLVLVMDMSMLLRMERNPLNRYLDHLRAL